MVKPIPKLPAAPASGNKKPIPLKVMQMTPPKTGKDPREVRVRKENTLGTTLKGFKK